MTNVNLTRKQADAAVRLLGRLIQMGVLDAADDEAAIDVQDALADQLEA